MTQSCMLAVLMPGSDGVIPPVWMTCAMKEDENKGVRGIRHPRQLSEGGV